MIYTELEKTHMVLVNTILGAVWDPREANLIEGVRSGCARRWFPWHFLVFVVVCMGCVAGSVFSAATHDTSATCAFVAMATWCASLAASGYWAWRIDRDLINACDAILERLHASAEAQ